MVRWARKIEGTLYPIGAVLGGKGEEGVPKFKGLEASPFSRPGYSEILALLSVPPHF